MKIFLDTANLEAVKKYAALGLVDGVTTNPSLIAMEDVSLEKRIKEIAQIIDGPISAEVISTEVKDMIKEGRKYAKWHKNVCVNCPMTEQGLEATKVLSSEGIKVNMTLVFSPSQALFAAKAGATFVSQFIGKLDDISEDGIASLAHIIDIYRNYDIKTQVIAASIRHPRHVIDAARLDADIATVPPEVLEKLMKHPLTDKGIKDFLADWEKVKDLQ